MRKACVIVIQAFLFPHLKVNFDKNVYNKFRNEGYNSNKTKVFYKPKWALIFILNSAQSK